jgi:hypothetical protein
VQKLYCIFFGLGLAKGLFLVRLLTLCSVGSMYLIIRANLVLLPVRKFPSLSVFVHSEMLGLL